MDVATTAERVAEGRAQILAELRKVIIGQDEVVEEVLIALFTGGHCLITGVPGLAKTLLIKTLAGVLDLDFKRIQFTPDLMPSDITGTEILDEDQGARRLHFVKGPIFAQIILADEINRTPPKTQAALLEAMQEAHVTAAGRTYPLEQPFFVLATQNPIEQEGTYPLPEAQLDRFLLQIDVGYPDLESERRMLLATTMGEEKSAARVCGPDDLLEVQTLVRRIPVGEKVMESILSLVRAARPDSDHDSGIKGQIAWGPGPRASQALMLAVRARALLEGRLAPSTDDVVALAGPVLRHRMALNFSARAEGATTASVIERLCHDLF
jgi:MoxR-like ATPase